MPGHTKDFERFGLAIEAKNRANPVLDLSRFLYRGAARVDARWVVKRIKNGDYGSPVNDRFKFLAACKDYEEGRLIMGGSFVSTRTRLTVLAHFIDYVDKSFLSLEFSDLRDVYLSYSEYLYDLSVREKKINARTANGYLLYLSRLIGDILLIPNEQRLHLRVRLRRSGVYPRVIGKAGEKLDLERAAIMGSFLIDLVAGLSKEAILGGLPLTVKARVDGINKKEIKFGTRFSGEHRLLSNAEKEELSGVARSEYQKMAEAISPSTVITNYRKPIVNIRVCAELMIFIAQTGMNPSQAMKMKRDRFHFLLAGKDHFDVRIYKNRRAGEVEFRIYKSYKPHLQRFIKFVEWAFPTSEYLFPMYGGVDKCKVKKFDRMTQLKSLLDRSGVPFVPAVSLRKIRINWILRRSGDPDLTAEVAQHTRQVLHAHYEQPNQQRAISEIIQFWASFDVDKLQERKDALVGQCNGSPDAVQDIPASVVTPNCLSQSGCLWCENHRDVRSFDYVWSLLSMRWLKMLESSQSIQGGEQAQLAVSRITSKIKAFEALGCEELSWVDEAKARVSEGSFHPRWRSLLEFWSD